MSKSESKTELYDLPTTEPAGSPDGPEKKLSRRAALFLRYVQPCLAELLGSMLFIFIGCLSVVENVNGTGRLQPALAHGLALGIVIRGAGGDQWWPLQPSSLCGGMIGAALAKAVSPVESYDNSSGGAFTTVQADVQIGRAVGAETIMTLFLTMVVCMGAVNGKTRSVLAPLCIGFTVAADILAGGAISGACMNPARAFGPAVAANYWTYHWIYWVGPMAGAVITGSIIKLLIGDEKVRVFLK
ncbi:hypothetical protein AALO_G00083060 [Alosa alosa]|uniref:Aquaporin 8 n=1 Tax=Alosa alosa TaxID=278164 RepID=A0AAV6GY64_9TELE|nr:hypothetical protein AALO_G00083060 [Alosa alosa]